MQIGFLKLLELEFGKSYSSVSNTILKLKIKN